MMPMRVFAVVLMTLLVAAPSALAEVKVMRGGLRAECEGLALELLSGDVQGGKLGLYDRTGTARAALEITDGRSGVALDRPTLSGPKAGGDSGTCTWAAEKLRGTWELATTDSSIEWDIAIENPGEEQRWLEVTVSLPAPLDVPWAAWDGISETPEVTQLVTRQGIAHAFPMMCVSDSKRGLALGLQPQMLLSSMSVGSDPARNDRTLYLTAQVIVDPGATETVELVSFPFGPEFGWRDALEKYYDLYPKWFNVAEGISPHIFGIGGYLRAGDSRLAWEEARRWRFGWDWGYAPYKKTGDWYPHEEYWENEYGGIEEYRAEMRRRYEVTNRAAAGLSYVILQFVEAELGNEHFADSLLRDARGDVITRPRDGVIKRGETATGAYYWGNSLGEHTLRCLEELAQKRGVAGISFDNSTGTGMRYGPGPEHSPGRAFSKNPDVVWAAEGIAIAKQMDKVHTLSNDQHRLMVFGNGPSCLLTCFRSDGVMHEASPYHRTESLEAKRRLMGHKPIICWEDHPEGMLNWENITPAELRQALRGDYDFWVMYCLYRGILPSAHRLRGNRVLQAHVEEILAVVRAGWQPVPAMRCEQDLWLGRFGRGVQTLLTLGNATGEDVQASVEVHNGYLGEGAYAFAPFDGEPGLRSEVFEGKTLVRLPIANRTTTLLRAALCVKGISEATAVSVAQATSPVQPATIRWQLSAPGGGTAQIEQWLPQGATVTGVRVGGEEATFNQEAATVSFAADLPERAPVAIEVDFVPQVVIADRARALEFPFLQDGQPACSIVCADDADEEVKFAAERIAAYFEYWTAAQVKPGATAGTLSQVEERALIPMTPASQADQATPMVAVGTYDSKLCHVPEGTKSAGFVAVRREPPAVLDVAGRDSDAVNKAALALMKLLDEKYEYYGRMGGGDPLLQRAGVAGEVFE